MHEETIDIDTNYVKYLKSHVARVAAHLNGTDHGYGSSRPSYYPPCGFWSPADKNLFFHALAVHSRLRPDLIAAEIPGKTTVDVCVYLDLLASASSQELGRWERSALLPAFEVSDEWVEFEEKQSHMMAAMEATWETEHREDRRAAALRAEHRAMRKQKGERPGGIRDREDEKRRNAILKDFQAKQEAIWKKEDYMGELGSAHLRVIDSILREAGDLSVATSPVLGSRSVEPVETENAIPDSVIDPVLLSIPGPSSVQLVKETGQIAPPTHVNVSEHDLEPEQSSILPIHPDVADEAEINTANSETDPFDNPADAVVDLANLSPISRRRHQKRLYMRRKRAEQSGKVVSAAATRLKPGRKSNKKLQIALARQKAQEKPNENMEVDEEVKSAEAAFTIPTQSEDEKEGYIDVYGGKEEFEISLRESHNDEPRRTGSPASGEEEASSFHPNIGGRTLPYKIKEELSAFGYNAATLESEGLGLFHLSRLADLMALHASFQASASNVTIRISTPLIRLLYAEVVGFLTDVMRRAIAMHEQERLSKEHTKVWRLREGQIKVATINQALETLGAAKNKGKHFDSLTSRLSSLRENGGDSEDWDEDAQTDDGGSGEDECGRDDSDNGEGISDSDQEQQVPIRGAAPALPVHREIYMPVIWHASLDHLDPDPYSPSKAFLATERDSDDVLGTSDDTELVDVILEEEDLDVADLAAAKEAEAELWAKFGPRKGAGEVAEKPLPVHRTADPVEIGDRRGISRLKFGKANARIKSNVYVEDSD